MELIAFRKEMNRLFDRFLGESSIEPVAPSVDISENDKEITFRAEVPGIEPGDVQVELSGNVLVIRGEKRESTEEKREDYYHCERRFGSFCRSFELPGTADLDGVEAEQRNGVLTIHVRKQAVARAKHVEVKPVGRAIRARETVP